MCPNGHPVSAGAKFCTKCGAQITIPDPNPGPWPRSPGPVKASDGARGAFGPNAVPVPANNHRSPALAIGLAATAVAIVAAIAIPRALNTGPPGSDVSPALVPGTQEEVLETAAPTVVEPGETRPDEIAAQAEQDQQLVGSSGSASLTDDDGFSFDVSWTVGAVEVETDAFAGTPNEPMTSVSWRAPVEWTITNTTRGHEARGPSIQFYLLYDLSFADWFRDQTESPLGPRLALFPPGARVPDESTLVPGGSVVYSIFDPGSRMLNPAWIPGRVNTGAMGNWVQTILPGESTTGSDAFGSHRDIPPELVDEYIRRLAAPVGSAALLSDNVESDLRGACFIRSSGNSRSDFTFDAGECQSRGNYRSVALSDGFAN